jgi:hypothetical protein
VRWSIGWNLFSLDPTLSEWNDPRRNGKNDEILAGYERADAAMVLEDDDEPDPEGLFGPELDP